MAPRLWMAAQQAPAIAADVTSDFICEQLCAELDDVPEAEGDSSAPEPAGIETEIHQRPGLKEELLSSA